MQCAQDTYGNHKILEDDHKIFLTFFTRHKRKHKITKKYYMF